MAVWFLLAAYFDSVFTQYQCRWTSNKKSIKVHSFLQKIINKPTKKKKNYIPKHLVLGRRTFSNIIIIFSVWRRGWKQFVCCEELIDWSWTAATYYTCHFFNYSIIIYYWNKQIYNTKLHSQTSSAGFVRRFGVRSCRRVRSTVAEMVDDEWTRCG